jgi:hypothetical protein
MTTSDPPTGPLQNYGLKSLLNRRTLGAKSFVSE